MKLSLQSIFVSWICCVSSLYLYGEAISKESRTQLSERSPFGMKPKKVIEVQPKQAPVIRQVPISIEFRGVAVTNKGIFCIFYDKEKKRGCSIRVGDESEGICVERYDEETQTVTLRTPNGMVELELVDPLQNKTSDTHQSSYNFGNDYNPFDDNPFDDYGNGNVPPDTYGSDEETY
jgi:hypothetical protein